MKRQHWIRQNGTKIFYLVKLLRNGIAGVLLLVFLWVELGHKLWKEGVSEPSFGVRPPLHPLIRLLVQKHLVVAIQPLFMGFLEIVMLNTRCFAWL